MGPAINNARSVTQVELIIKDKKPNFPESGFHSLENNRSQRDSCPNNIEDFRYKPTPRKNGIRITKTSVRIIQIP